MKSLLHENMFIYPIASDMKEWERKVIKYVSENYEKRIQLLEQKIKHWEKIPKRRKRECCERRTKWQI